MCSSAFAGTHCAGIAAGYDHGVAKGVFVVPVKVLDMDGVGSLSSVLSGFSWAMDEILQHRFPSVLSLSFASARSESVNKAMERLYEAGMALSKQEFNAIIFHILNVLNLVCTPKR